MAMAHQSRRRPRHHHRRPSNNTASVAAAVRAVALVATTAVVCTLWAGYGSLGGESSRSHGHGEPAIVGVDGHASDPLLSSDGAKPPPPSAAWPFPGASAARTGKGRSHTSPSAGNAAQAPRSNHTNNWAVIVGTSTFWFNYRHTSNALSVYHTLKRLGMPDSHIILMLGEDAACNPRNPHKSQVFDSAAHKRNLYDDDVSVDYRGSEVNVANLLSLLTGRHDPHVPPSKRLLSDEGSNVLLFMSGHGGDGFLKFLDFEEVGAMDLADAVDEMHEKRRYNELLVVVDTCQAATLGEDLRSPGCAFVGSSVRDQNAYSMNVDMDVGVSMTDRFTFHALDYFDTHSSDLRRGQRSDATVNDLLSTLTFAKLRSHWNVRTDLLGRNLGTVPLSDFFTAVSSVTVGARGDGYEYAAAAALAAGGTAELPHGDHGQGRGSEGAVLATWLGRVDLDRDARTVPAAGTPTNHANGSGSSDRQRHAIDWSSTAACCAVLALVAVVADWSERRTLRRGAEALPKDDPVRRVAGILAREWVPFARMDGAGNDFVVIDARGRPELEAELHASPLAREAIARRDGGIGCDQLVLLLGDDGSGSGEGEGKGQDRSGAVASGSAAATNPALRARIRFYNTDGSEAGACGNGTRAAALFVAHTAARASTASYVSEGLRVQGCEVVDGSPPLRLCTGEPRQLPSQVVPWPALPPRPQTLPAGWLRRRDPTDTATNSKPLAAVAAAPARGVDDKARASGTVPDGADDDLWCAARAWVQVDMGAPRLAWDRVPLGPDHRGCDTADVRVPLGELWERIARRAGAPAAATAKTSTTSGAAGSGVKSVDSGRDELARSLGLAVRGDADAAGDVDGDDDAYVSMACSSFGNPHGVVFVPDVSAVDVAAVGAALALDKVTFPAGANVSFVQCTREGASGGGTDATLLMRVWERGVGETLACGSGACAAVVAAVRTGRVARGASVLLWLRGGAMVMRWGAIGGGDGDHVHMSGPARLQLFGRLRLAPGVGGGDVACMWREGE